MNRVLMNLHESLKYARGTDKYRLLVLIDKIKAGMYTKEEIVREVALTSCDRSDVCGFQALVYASDDLIRGTLQ